MTEIITTVTPLKYPHGSRSNRSKNSESSKLCENFNPNSSTLLKSAKSRKSACKKQNPVSKLPQNNMKERKFVVAKRGSKKNTKEKSLSVAYENLRASQEEFFKNESDGVMIPSMIQDCDVGDQSFDGLDECRVGNSVVKRRRERLMEEARNSLPESGCGRVMHLVKAFENLLSMPKGLDKDDGDGEEGKKMAKWALPGLHTPKECELVLTSEKLGLGSSNISVSSSFDDSHGSVSSRTSNGGQRSRRNSTESTDTMGGRLKKKQLRVTSQQPFKLRTEQRGKSKEEEFKMKLRELTIEEERLRIPVAQGLPVTTDEPELLIKPPVKESTLPLDLRFHTDLRAEDRADFDHQIAEKMNLIEQYKRERERQRKLEDEEEVRRLRKELVPKAQPMPYFDRPFIPKRCTKHPTKPKEPKFHMPEHKKINCGQSLNDNKSSV